MNNRETGISIIIPCHNESKTIVPIIQKLNEALSGSQVLFEIIVVDDSSNDGTAQKLAGMNIQTCKVLANDYQLGYGGSIKKGIKKATYQWIGICDADGTYPVQRFSDFLKYISDFDMVVGVRTGKIRSIPLLRRPAKWFLNRFSSYLVKRKIADVNSGMRIFRKDVALKYWNLYPDGFSFTTTMTLSFISGNHPIKDLSIDYLKRKGKSKIKPFQDTYQFILLILRLAMQFNPLRVFMPAFFVIFLMTLFSLVRDLINLNLTDTTVMLFIFSIIMLMIGLLADLINKKGSQGWGD
jgi:glycosyltransferase involved in cell wall biosynthesis